MSFRPKGSKPDDVLKFEGDAIREMRVDPNISRYGTPPIDLSFCWDLVRHGQLEPGLIRRDSTKEPVLFVGNRRRLHILYINDHQEDFATYPESGEPALVGPMSFSVKFRPVTVQQAEEMALSENLQRKDLRTVDKAQLAQRYALQDRDPKWIAERLAVTTSRVTQL